MAIKSSLAFCSAFMSGVHTRNYRDRTLKSIAVMSVVGGAHARAFTFRHRRRVAVSAAGCSSNSVAFCLGVGINKPRGFYIAYRAYFKFDVDDS